MELLLKFTFSLLVLLSESSMGYAQTPSSVDATLKILVVDGFGSTISKGQLIVKSEAGLIVYSGDVDRITSLRLPYGRYSAAVRADFYDPVNRDIDLESPDCFAVLVTHFGRFALETPNEPVSVTVKVTPGSACKTGGTLWAKLSAVFGDYASERIVKPIGSSGAALFEPVEPGKYVLTVIDDQTVRAIRVIDANRSLTSVDLTLGACDVQPR